MTQRTVRTDGVELCLETFGDPADPALLLISGAAGSMDQWEPAFCARLAGEGRFVIRYDHRDTGGSSTSPVGAPSYSGDDLATDPVRILDALGIDRAHLVGISMGGGLAQYLAARRAERLLTLTLIATSPAGECSERRSLPPSEPRIRAVFENPAPEPAWDDRSAVIDYLVEAERPFAGSLGFDEQRARRTATVVVDRTRDIAASVTNHWVIDGGSTDRFRLADITLPTLVLHGTDDPLFPLGHGEALAAEIPGATFVPLHGMGHEMPPRPLWDTAVSAIVGHTAQRRT
ncbi:alpha/beta fold hydrolase [Amycolatopsis cihanbeyliensis]|uniref:Pimeloyl-ACP methyl ester carboxylesterase n=1 Tax=Amycolatopsis cihanbeyliensis TaxID=1128664 RepID=A0A542DEI3_AMYCI|nr:alpha/beta hydrolase [Amycolatopsis cihanbeyliensis]TQJ01481.1 pimeloyl-ACP methyl ester carboxylesterase [Amycolatopsis cihanbeyliensis]